MLHILSAILWAVPDASSLVIEFNHSCLHSFCILFYGQQYLPFSVLWLSSISTTCSRFVWDYTSTKICWPRSVIKFNQCSMFSIYAIFWTLLVVSNPVIVFSQCCMISLCMLSLWSWFYVLWNYVLLVISSQVIKFNQRYMFSFLHVSIGTTCRLLSCDGIQPVQVFSFIWALLQYRLLNAIKTTFSVLHDCMSSTNPVIEFNQWST